MNNRFSNVFSFEFTVELASRIPHDLKKSFCDDTKQIFHAEFARLINLLILCAHDDVSYIFCAFEELPMGYYESIGFRHVLPLNAKAQFQCTGCKRLWTSMRARSAFHITEPRQYGWIVLQIFGQECQICGAEAEALWYPGKLDHPYEFSLDKNVRFRFCRRSLSRDGRIGPSFVSILLSSSTSLT